MLKIGIFGISGRMGQAISEAVKKNPRTELIGGTVKNIENKSFDCFFTDNPKILVQKSDILIDFTHAEALKNHLTIVQEAKKPIVIGTTGFDKNTEFFLNQTSKEIPLLQSGNMSLGVNLLEKLVKQVASVLDNEWDIEITEAHHKHKIDSPSGTAIMLGKAAAEGRKVSFNSVKKLSREGLEEPRSRGEIGFSTIRAGSIIGEHSVLFANDDEIVTLSHKAQNRTIFANGAVYAAERLVNLPNGFYTMQDILPL